MMRAMRFTHDRTVVLSPSGQVRAVFGDGSPGVIVS
jgi:hypothetical protein